MPLKSFTIPSAILSRRIVVKAMHVHAIGLTHPGHMEWTQNDRLFVSEFGRGRVIDITDPGDYRDATPFAYGLEYPAAIITNYQGSRIIVADSGHDCIYDITNGGDFSRAAPIFSGIPAPYGMAIFNNELYATYTDHNDNGLAKISGSSFSSANEFAPGFPSGISEHPYYLALSGACGSWTGIVANTRILYSQTVTGTIWDVTNGGRFDRRTHPRIAYGLNKPVGMIYNSTLDLVIVTEIGTGTVKAVPLDGNVDVRHIPAFAVGFKEPRCVRFSRNNAELYVCDMSSCCVWRLEIDIT